MRKFWSVILPVTGLILFAVVSYRSALANHETQNAPGKYLWWSSLRLDSDPLNEHPIPVSPCENAKAKCGNDDLADKKVAPGWSDKLLIISALPAFLAGAGIVMGLSMAGIDEVLSFMVAMPILLFAWYYFIGWLIDRWRRRRKEAKTNVFKAA
jgi:hypothetical protein